MSNCCREKRNTKRVKESDIIICQQVKRKEINKYFVLTIYNILLHETGVGESNTGCI